MLMPPSIPKRLKALGDVLAEHHRVNQEVARQQNPDRHEPGCEQMARGPEKAHALEEAEKERRVTERREGTANIGHQKNKEDKGMHFALAVFIGADERTDKQHGRPRRPHEIREHRTERKKGRIDDRTADKAAAHMNTTCHDKERADKNQKRQIVSEKNMRNRVKCHVAAIEDPHRHGTAERPENSDFAEVMMPDMRGEQRKKGNGEENPRKRNGPGEPQRRTIKAGRGESSHRQQKPARGGSSSNSSKQHKLKLPSLAIPAPLTDPGTVRQITEKGVRWKSRLNVR